MNEMLEEWREFEFVGEEEVANLSRPMPGLRDFTREIRLRLVVGRCLSAESVMKVGLHIGVWTMLNF